MHRCDQIATKLFLKNFGPQQEQRHHQHHHHHHQYYQHHRYRNINATTATIIIIIISSSNNNATIFDSNSIKSTIAASNPAAFAIFVASWSS